MTWSAANYNGTQSTNSSARNALRSARELSEFAALGWLRASA